MYWQLGALHDDDDDGADDDGSPGGKCRTTVLHHARRIAQRMMHRKEGGLLAQVFVAWSDLVNEARFKKGIVEDRCFVTFRWDGVGGRGWGVKGGG